MRRKHHRRYQGRFTRLASLARSLPAPAAAGLLAVLAVPLVIMPMPAQAQGNAQSVTYSVTFEGKFTASALASGVSVPSGEHFTTLIGAVHNDSVTFWSSGGTASAGIESMAEVGGTSALKSEINASSNALAVIEQSIASGGTATATVDITLTTAHPLVTLASMVAPSPDWFVGVSGLSLRNTSDDGWQPSLTVDLFPYDAGTEEGTEFSLNNAATSPQGTIASIKGMGKFSNERIATLTFTRQSVNTAPSFTSDTSFEADENQTAAGRVAAGDPDSGDGVTYAITGGADTSKFNIGETTGVLTFRVPPNYERAADVASTDPPNDAGNNEYIVTVTATGGTGDRAMTAEQTIAVTVRNLDEAGTISFSQGGTRITAVLSDPDGGVNGGTWQWARPSDRNTGWMNIGSATSASYTPASGDQGMYLRATASYNDAHDSGKQAYGISTNEIAPPNLRVATIVSGLSIPWDIAFTPDGTMLFTQRAGVLSSRLADGTVQTIDAEFGDLFARGETGLMGIVVDPGFASNRRFYTCQGHTGPEIQVIAWTLNAAYTQATRVADPLVGGIPASSGRHGGCRLRFGPEGYLWIATGDAASGTVPQDLTSLGGKALRVDASTGAGAPTNPFAPSRVYTYGHRNVQGLALRPGTSQMWSVEHGPSVDDEINRLVAGRNYGWNPVPGYNERVPMTDLVEYPDAVEAKWSSGSSTLATSGAIFLEGNQWGVWEGRLAVATLADRKLRLFEFTPDGAFVSQVVVAELDGAFGRLRTPMMGPDGALYVSTSNGGGADRILRITPSPTPPPPPPPPPTTGGGGGGGGGGGRARPPSYPGTMRAEDGDGEVTLTWDAPASQGSSRIQYYEYRIDGEGEWISTESTDRIHTITGLINGRVYFFHLRAVSAAGAGSHRISPEATPVADLDFTHFANGGFITSTLALVNAGAYPVRPAIYFYDQDGDPIAARSVVDLTPDLEVGDDGALRPRTVLNPLGELTIATHGRGGQRVGSVTVRAASSIGGVLRFDIPGFGVAGVGDSPTLRDALVPVRRQDGGINTGVAVRNRGTATLTLQCRLMRDGAVIEETVIPLAANGQDSRFIDQVFPAADTSDFAGSVRCAAPEPGRFSAVAFELDGTNRIFTTLPVVPVPAVLDQEQEQEEEQGQEQEEEQDATRLDFTHFANGGKIVSSLVLVNAGANPVRPAIYFHDQDGGAIAAEAMLDVPADMEIGDDGALRPGTAMNPLGELTISTHGRGVLKVGSVAVVAEGPVGGVLRFDIPRLGVAGVGDSPPVRDALVPVRRQDGGINTGVAIHNRGTTALLVRCRLMRDGAVLEETMIPLAANGQDSRFLDQVFPTADTSDFAGSMRCMTPEPGLFSAVAFELDGVNRIFTTLPVVPVVEVP